ncbi:MAG: manganese ABC transporter permease [Phycisphaerales bacterium]|nr:MAG: manganese ABC transporter permease [Phycisphaerales bacterium]
MTLTPALDLFPLAAAVLSAICCGLLGNFLVLRRLSLMGDAMSHSVLPGLVVAFMLTGSRAAPVMFAGAAAAGLVTVLLVELVKRLGRLEPGAAMGVVFSVMFALGVLLIERVARNTDLDAECVLHGQLETLIFDGPMRWGSLRWSAVLEHAPPAVWTLALTAALCLAVVALLYKELRLAAFDPQLASALGFNATGLHVLLMVLVAAAVVASFEAVGSILVIAMLIVPAATARLLTDRLITQLLVSLAVAVASAVLGYVGATAVPQALGAGPVNAAGAIAVVLGVMLALAAAFSPSHGVLAGAIRRMRMARRIALDDLLAELYRLEERAAGPPASSEPSADGSAMDLPAGVLARARAMGLVRKDGLALTEPGRRKAQELVRRHRLWEAYLVQRAGLPPDHVHDPAQRLEHIEQAQPPQHEPTDPHGRAIPPKAP